MSITNAGTSTTFFASSNSLQKQVIDGHSSYSRMKYLIIIFTIFCSGCVVYPINKILQPKAEILVIEEEGKPVGDAWVYLISNSYPYGSEKRRMRDKTNSNGEAHFPKIKEWRTEALMIHGSEVFFWNWCVIKEGYKTHVTNWSSGKDFSKKYKIKLNSGVSYPCPEEFNKIRHEVNYQDVQK